MPGSDLDRTQPRRRTFAFNGKAPSGSLAELAGELGAALERGGFRRVEDPRRSDLVISLVDPEEPRPFRRRSRSVYVAALHELPEVPDDAVKASYPVLVRALANLALCYVPGQGVWFTTMERGHYGVTASDGMSALTDAVVERLTPLATATLVIDNEFRTDLEPELWRGDDVTAQIRAAGERLGDLDLLPAPFPLEELLDDSALRHVKRLFGIGGLSYGNISARKDAKRFWMSASGVDKTKLEIAGRDILLVSDYDERRKRIIVSVPPDIEPRRVSVDAIEHWTIYQRHPGIGALLHVHAWMEGIAATEINYPCGTEELARSVAELLAREPDPHHAVIGLLNHGVTATGESLAEILDRIEPRVLRQVPMS